MGTAATTLSTLLGNKVNITTPKVSICQFAKEADFPEENYLSVEVSYVQGIDGYNILLIKEEDVAAITSILMGEEYDPNKRIELDELHFSAISEVMNQMVGSSATALSNIVKRAVNISPPIVRQIETDGDEAEKLVCRNDITIRISFDMEIEGVLKSEIMQIMPFEFGKKLALGLLNEVMKTEPKRPEAKPVAAPSQREQVPVSAPPKMERSVPTESNRIGVRSVQYQSFDASGKGAGNAEAKENIDFIMDVPLQVTVELGQCKKTIKEILSLGMGSVIVLDKLAGEMVDIFVNGKLFAKGEVVVIDDNYGVRVTDIVAEPKL